MSINFKPADPRGSRAFLNQRCRGPDYVWRRYLSSEDQVGKRSLRLRFARHHIFLPVVFPVRSDLPSGRPSLPAEIRHDPRGSEIREAFDTPLSLPSPIARAFVSPRSDFAPFPRVFSRPYAEMALRVAVLLCLAAVATATGPFLGTDKNFDKDVLNSGKNVFVKFLARGYPSSSALSQHQTLPLYLPVRRCDPSLFRCRSPPSFRPA